MAAYTRAQIIADARAMLDFLEAHPDVPLNQFRGVEISNHPLPSSETDDADKMAAIDAIADLLGTPVTTPATPGSHYETEICFGSASYRAISVLKEYHEEYDAIQRYGQAALKEIKEIEAAKAEVAEAAVRRDMPCICSTSPNACLAADHIDYDEIAAVREIEEEMALEAAGVESWDEL